MIQFDAYTVKNLLVPFLKERVLPLIEQDPEILRIISTQFVENENKIFFQKVFLNWKGDFRDKIAPYSDILLQSIKLYYRVFLKRGKLNLSQEDEHKILQLSYIFLENVKDYEFQKIAKTEEDVKAYKKGKIYLYYDEGDNLAYRTRDNLKEDSVSTNFKPFIGIRGGVKTGNYLYQNRDKALEEIDNQILLRLQEEYITNGYTILNNFEIQNNKIYGRVKTFDLTAQDIEIDLNSLDDFRIEIPKPQNAVSAVKNYEKGIKELKKEGRANVPQYVNRRQNQDTKQKEIQKQQEENQKIQQNLLTKTYENVKKFSQIIKNQKTQKPKKKFWTPYKVAAFGTIGAGLPVAVVIADSVLDLGIF